MSTLMSTDLSYHRPSTRVRASPGGKTSICFGDEFDAAVPAADAPVTIKGRRDQNSQLSYRSSAVQILNTYLS